MSPRYTQPSSKMTISEILVLLLLNFCLLAIVAVDSQETNCSTIINENIKLNLESSIVEISKKSCSIINDEDRVCVCGSIQTLQDSASQTLTVDLQCSCAFSKSVNCTQTECSPENPPTTESIKASERSSMLMPTTTTNMLTTQGKKPTTYKESETLSSKPTSKDGITTSGMYNYNCEAAFGSVSGILGGLLIAAVVGWIITCVIMSRKETHESTNLSLHARNHTALVNSVYTPQLQHAQCDPSQGCPCTSQAPDYEIIDAEQDYDVTNHSPPPATPTGSHDRAPASTYSRLAGDRHTYYTLEPSEDMEEKGEERSVVSGDADGAQSVNEGQDGEEGVLVMGGHNVNSEV